MLLQLLPPPTVRSVARTASPSRRNAHTTRLWMPFGASISSPPSSGPTSRAKALTASKRWTRRIDIFSKDIILFPINLGNSHWVCGAINMRKHRFEYYDSLGARNNSAFTLMRTYVTEEARDKKKKEIDLRGWTDLFSDQSPQQENGYDCGVFASQTLEQISRRSFHRPIPLDPPIIVWKDDSLDETAGKINIVERTVVAGMTRTMRSTSGTLSSRTCRICVRGWLARFIRSICSIERGSHPIHPGILNQVAATVILCYESFAASPSITSEIYEQAETPLGTHEPERCECCSREDPASGPKSRVPQDQKKLKRKL